MHVEQILQHSQDAVPRFDIVRLVAFSDQNEFFSKPICNYIVCIFCQSSYISVCNIKDTLHLNLCKKHEKYAARVGQ